MIMGRVGAMVMMVGFSMVMVVIMIMIVLVLRMAVAVVLGMVVASLILAKEVKVGMTATVMG